MWDFDLVPAPATASVRPKKMANSEEIDETLPPLNLHVPSSCNCFDYENRLCLASFHSHRDPEDEDGEESIVDPLRDLLINSEDEEDESDSDPDSSEPEHEADRYRCKHRGAGVCGISLSLGQTGRNDTRKVLTSVIIHLKYFPDSDWLKAHV